MTNPIHMNLKTAFCFIFAFSISTFLFSQKGWSLDECVSYALKNNLTVNDLTYTEKTNKEKYKQSVRNLLPSVVGTADYNIRFGRSVDPNDNTIVNTDFFSNNYSLEASLDLFEGFQKLNVIQANKFIRKASHQETMQEKYLLAFRVMSAYYDIEFAQGLYAISTQQEEVSKGNFSLVKKQIELGLKAGADLYEAESVLLTDKLKTTQAKNTLDAAKLKLIQEMNLEDTEGFEILNDVLEENTDANILEMEIDTIYSNARNFIPVIKAQELRARAARKEVAVARGSLYPSLSLFAGYGTGYFETTVSSDGNIIPFRDQIEDNAFQFVGASLKFNVFNKWSIRSNIKEQKIALMRARNNLKIEEQELMNVIQQLVQENNSLNVEYEQSTNKVNAQELAFKTAQKKYEKGLINLLDLLQAKNLFASAQNENLQVKLQLKVNNKTLDFYKGLPIFNINPSSN